MLEILFVIFIYRKLKNRLEARNRGQRLAWLGPALWLGGEFLGGFVGALVFDILGISTEGSFTLYGIALLCAALGSVVAFIVVFRLPPKTLSCPKCSLAFKGNAKWGIQCESCDAKLKVVEGKVTLLETA